MFHCNSCSYSTDVKFNYDRHTKSSKHLKKTEIPELSENLKPVVSLKLNAPEELKSFKKCPDCEKVFRHSSSYHRHRKYRCGTIKDEKDEEDDLIRLKHQVELLQQQMKFKSTISNLEKQNAELERDLTIQSCHEKLEYIENNQKLIVANKSLTQQNTVNISNPSIISKQNNLNVHFGEMIDLDTFIENYSTTCPLTFDETKVLLENYHHSGIKSYGPGLFAFLKKNCSRQLSELIGEEVNTPILPFVVSDSGLRKHLEKTPDGWFPISTRDKIKKLVVISNDQIYKYHKDCIPMSAYEKELITNAILRKSDYHCAQLAIQKRKDDECRNCLRSLPELTIEDFEEFDNSEWMDDQLNDSPNDSPND